MIHREVFSKQLILVSTPIFCSLLALSYPYFPFQSAQLFFAFKFQKSKPWKIQTLRKKNRYIWMNSVKEKVRLQPSHITLQHTQNP